MKRLLLIICAIVMFAAQIEAQTGKLIVRFENLKSNDGKVMVSLFEGKENFAKKQSTDKVTLSIENNSAIWSLESLPEGHYIIIAYHDENENQKIDLGIMGIPAEGYAFSNNTVSEMGPPNPDQMLFEVKSDETTTQVLKMVYFDFSVLQME